MREHAYGLRDPAFGIFKTCKGGDKPAADVRLVAYAEKIGMEEGDALHVAHGLENEGGLSGPAVALHDDVLAGLYARSEFALKCRTRAEEVSVNSASVFEWVHFRFSISGCCAKRYYAKRYYAVWQNADSVSYFSDESNTGRHERLLLNQSNQVTATHPDSLMERRRPGGSLGQRASCPLRSRRSATLPLGQRASRPLLARLTGKAAFQTAAFPADGPRRPMRRQDGGVPSQTAWRYSRRTSANRMFSSFSTHPMSPSLRAEGMMCNQHA